VSFLEPHSPFDFPAEYANKYSPDGFLVPAPGPEDGPQIPIVFRDLTAADKRGIVAVYDTSVEYLDHNAGRLLRKPGRA
jgi:choline-sulfatase